MQINPKDPLLNAPPAEVELFKRVVALCDGFPRDVVVSVAFNLLINLIRQIEPNQLKALAMYDEVSTKVRAALAEHYGVNGSRRNIFPFDQVVQVPMLDLRKQRK